MRPATGFPVGASKRFRVGVKAGQEIGVVAFLALSLCYASSDLYPSWVAYLLHCAGQACWRGLWILSGGLARALSGSEFRIGLAAKTQSPAGSGHARRELLQQGLGASLYTYTALMYIIKSPNILLVNAAISCFHPSMIRPGSEMYPRSGLFPFLVL